MYGTLRVNAYNAQSLKKRSPDTFTLQIGAEKIKRYHSIRNFVSFPKMNKICEIRIPLYIKNCTNFEKIFETA